MKKLLIITIIFMLILSVCACQNEKTASNTNTAANTSSTVSTSSNINDTSSDTASSSETDNTQSISSSATTSVESKPQHTHTFSDATCKTPAKCSCGKTQGEPLEHIFNDAVCILCDYESLNSNASHGSYEAVIDNKDGFITSIKVDFYHDTELIIIMASKYSLLLPPGADRQTPVINYNGNQYYHCQNLTLGDGEGYNLDITDTTVAFDSYDLKYHFVFEFTGNSFIIKDSNYSEYPVGAEIKMTTDWH